MKAIMRFLIILNIAFGIFEGVLVYSEQIMASISAGKRCINIEKPSEISNTEFIECLIDVAKEEKTDILTEITQKTETFKPVYNIYKTSNSEAFLKLSMKTGGTLLETTDTILSTDRKIGDRLILGSTLLYEVNIFDFSKIADNSLSNNKYYISEENYQGFLEALVRRGYFVSLEETDILYQTDYTILILANVVLLLFLLISCIFYAWQIGKNTVLKKLNGYSNVAVVIDEVMPELAVDAIALISIYLLSLICIATLYPESVTEYLKNTIFDDFVLFAITVAIQITGFFAMIMQRSVLEIKGRKPSTAMYRITVIIKIVICLLTIIVANLCYVLSKNYFRMSREMEETKLFLQDYFTVSYNVSRVDIDAQVEEYENRSENFAKAMMETHDTILADTSDFIGINDSSAIGNIIINKNYLDYNPLYKPNGALIAEDDFENEKINILIPETIDISKLPLEITWYSQYGELNVIKYRSGQFCRRINPSTAVDNNGKYSNAILVICEENILHLKAMSFLSSGYIYFKSKTENPYTEISPYLEKFKLDEVILEAPFVSGFFDSEIAIAVNNLTISSISFLVALLILVVNVVFENILYFTNHQKELAIKALCGYSAREALKGLILIDIITSFLILILSAIMSICLLFPIVVILFNTVARLVLYRKYLQNNINQIIMGYS